jgi:hypothetical protein
MHRASRIGIAVALVCASATAHADPSWLLQPYGFLELDTIYDTTQGMGDVVGNDLIARPQTYAGNHGQLTFSSRATRLGLALTAPAYGSLHTVATLEADLLGSTPAGTSDIATWQDPSPRLRQANVAMTSPIVDVIVGQTWQLFGGQPLFMPATVAIQGVVGEVYARAPQLRVTREIPLGSHVTVEVALAAASPPQRAGAAPDGQAELSLVFPHVHVRHAGEGATSRVDPLTLSAAGILRRFAVDNIAPGPSYEVVRDGYGIGGFALLPVRDGDGSHAVTLIATIVSGAGISDLYQSLTNGVSNPVVPGYVANIDPDLAMWAADGRSPSGYSLHTIQCESELFSLQYFPSQRTWFGANFGHFHSGNAASFGPRPQVWNDEDFLDVNAFFSLTPQLRFAVGGAWFQQGYVDQTLARDLRAQASAFLVF